jgi:tRNA pseudouridine38-40 synthase
MEISFDGSNYGGWQIQSNRESVQQTIEKVLSSLYNYQKIELVGSSRTDAGVLASNFAAAFLVPKSPAIPIGKLKNSLNMMLPSDIKIQTIK